MTTMPLHFRLAHKGAEGAMVVVETRPKRLPMSLKRTPTFATLLRKEVLGLRSFDPMFRYSLTRLPEEESSGEAGRKEGEGPGEGRCGEQWGNIRDAVDRVVRHCCRGKPPSAGQVAGPLAEGELSALHSDVRVLLRTEAGAFIFEYLKDKLLPAAASEVLAEIRRRSTADAGGAAKTVPLDASEGDATDARKLCAELSSTWEYFYCHSLTLLEAIFYQVKSRNLGIRQAGLMTFRDHIVLPLKPELEKILDGYKPAGETYKGLKNEVPPMIKQMLLILQGVNESCPPSAERLKLENLVARAITPYLGFRGMYEGGNPEPSKPSQELAVIHKRRPSVVDPRHLSRPLSIVGNGQVETLSELFTLSADRILHRRTFNRHNAHHDL